MTDSSVRIPEISQRHDGREIDCEEVVTGSGTVERQRVAAVLQATKSGGGSVNVGGTSEGHLQVDIRGPLLPFGSLHAESLTPVLQCDPLYGINVDSVIATTGLGYDPGPAIGSNTGSATTANNMFVCSTGTTAFSFGSIQSRKRLRYRAGQGVVGKFSALWSTPAANTIVVAGLGTAESGFYFGYNGTRFGILHVDGTGKREIQAFTVSAPTTTGGTVTFRLNGLDTTVTLPTAATTARTAYDIASKNFPGWDTEARGSTVIFVANSAGNKAGTFSMTLGTAIGTAGTFAETQAGVASTDTWIYQEDWNGDTLDGTGPSGFNLNPSFGNVFRIYVQHLGFGPIKFQVESTSDSGSDSDWITVHSIQSPNTRLTPTVGQPSFPFTMAAYSAGSTTNVSVSCGSFGGFVEGQKKLNGPRMTYFRETNNYVGSAPATYYPIFSFRNDFVYANRVNQSVINLISIACAHDDATPVTIYLIRDATLSGPVSFAQWTTTSCTYYDEGATTCTFTDKQQVVFSLPIGQNSSVALAFVDDITLEPGEMMTLAARAVTGTATYVNVSLNTREDQ